jgi:uroporphyrinogen-III synthase
MFLVHLQLKVLTNNKIKNEICFLSVLPLQNIRVKENKEHCNCWNTIEDVIVEVIAYYNTEESIEPSAKI